MTRIMRTRPILQNAARWTRRKPLVLETLEDRTVPSFLPAVHYPTSDFPELLATGDFNGDGNRDFASTVVGAQNLGVRLGAGDGAFSGLATLTVGSYPMGIVAADLNSDGCDDLLNTNEYTNNFSVHLSDCDGTFAPSTSHAAGIRPYGIAVADYNLDSYLDVATANYEVANASVMFGGAGGFAPPVNYATGVLPYFVINEDVNYDGAPDLVVSNDDSISVLINYGDGTFAPAANYAIGLHALGVVSADLNGDGLRDLAVGSAWDYISILISNGDGTFQPATQVAIGAKTYPAMIAAADYDGNGTSDLAVSLHQVDQLAVLLGNGDGTFQAPLNFATLAAPFGLVADDFNGDGYSDLAVANLLDGSVSVFLNDATWGSFPHGGGNGEVSRRFARPEHSEVGFRSTSESARATAAAAAAMPTEQIASPISADSLPGTRRTETIKVVDELFALNLL